MTTVDLSTTNVIDTKSGTSWTIDVTACNLSDDITVKDFNVLIDSALVANSSFTKTSQTVLTYSGADVGTDATVEVRRNTPEDRIQRITYGTRINSAVYNEELDALVRKWYEARLNGVGAGSVVETVAPLDQAYGSSWSTDTLRSRTANRLYTEFELRAPLASPTFTGSVVVPSLSDLSGNTQAANTSYVDTRVSNALTSSPVLGGTPTLSSSPASGDDSLKVASTAFVQDNYAIGSGVFDRSGVGGSAWNFNGAGVVTGSAGVASPIFFNGTFTSTDTLELTSFRIRVKRTGYVYFSFSCYLQGAAGSGGANLAVYIGTLTNPTAGNQNVISATKLKDASNAFDNCSFSGVFPCTANDYVIPLISVGGTGTYTLAEANVNVAYLGR